MAKGFSVIRDVSLGPILAQAAPAASRVAQAALRAALRAPWTAATATS
jgi:hypothetical protein